MPPFVRKTKIKGHEYVYLVENYRDSLGRRRQRVLEYLGPVERVYRKHASVDFEAMKRKYAVRPKTGK